MVQFGTEILRQALSQGEAKPEVWIRFPRQLGDVIFALPFLGSLQRDWNAAAAELGVQLRWVAVGHSFGCLALAICANSSIRNSVALCSMRTDSALSGKRGS